MAITEQDLKVMQDRLQEKQTSIFPIKEAKKQKTDKTFRTYRVIISGEPMAKQSVRVMVLRYRKGHPKSGEPILSINKKTGLLDVTLLHYQPTKFQQAEFKIKAALKEKIKEDGFQIYENCVHITKYEFIFKALKSFSKKQIEMLNNHEIIEKFTKPDLPDNLKKFYNDCLSGIIWKDDSIISRENEVIKRYGIKPGVIIEMEGY